MSADRAHMIKSILKRSQQNVLADTAQAEFKEFRRMLQGPKAKEAMNAFMERRAADFSKF